MGEFLAGASWGVWFVMAAIIAAGLWAIVHYWTSGDIAVAMIGRAQRSGHGERAGRVARHALVWPTSLREVASLPFAQDLLCQWLH